MITARLGVLRRAGLAEAEETIADHDARVDDALALEPVRRAREHGAL